MVALVAELEADLAAGLAGPLTARDVKRFRNFAGPSYCGGDELDRLRSQMAQRLLDERHPVTEKQDLRARPGAHGTDRPQPQRRTSQ